MHLRSVVILAACLSSAPAALADPRITYETETSYDTNYFSDRSNIAALSLRTTVGFEGELERDGTKFGYAFNHQEVLVPRYRFADEHNSWVNFSLSQKVSDRLEWQMQMRGTRAFSGDIVDPDLKDLVTYRQLDHKLDFSTSVTLAALGGRTTLSGSYTALLKGKARFRPAGIMTARLEANEALAAIKAEHLREFAGGEIGLTGAYNVALVPENQQQIYERFPASNLRGSLAFGRKFGERFAVLGEVGLTTLRGSEISNEVKRTRPYLRAEAEWQLHDSIALAAGYSQDYALFDLDDPIAEFQHRWKMVMKTKLTEKLTADLALERSRNEWVYYDNVSTQRRLVATLAFDTGKDRKLELEFSRLLHDSDDRNDVYRGSSISTRLSGIF